MEPKITKSDRQIRWNSEPSPDNDKMLRYHIVVVAQKRSDRLNLMSKFINSLRKWGGSILDDIRQPVKGEVKDSDRGYFFRSYDSLASPRQLGHNNVGGTPVINDTELYERIGSPDELDNYVIKYFEE